MKIKLLNPYYEEEIEVLENIDYFNDAYKNILSGNEECIKLTQIKCYSSRGPESYSDERIVFINPRHWAKVELIDDELVEEEEYED